jgi:hypothetical protein
MQTTANENANAKMQTKNANCKLQIEMQTALV